MRTKTVWHWPEYTARWRKTLLPIKYEIFIFSPTYYTSCFCKFNSDDDWLLNFHSWLIFYSIRKTSTQLQRSYLLVLLVVNVADLRSGSGKVWDFCTQRIRIFNLEKGRFFNNIFANTNNIVERTLLEQCLAVIFLLVQILNCPCHLYGSVQCTPSDAQLNPI